MNKKQKGLGKGMDAILPYEAKFSEIAIVDIETNPFQPRIKFDGEALNELAASIRELGIIQPITVRELGYNKYQLISGERRFRASQVAHLTQIPAYIRKANDQEMLEMALVENIQRKDLNPIEIALSFRRLIEECNLTHEACSERVGKNRATISNFLRLLNLPEEIQIALQKKRISAGHARALLSIKNKQSQLNLFQDTVAYKYSVREVEQLAKDFAEESYKKTSKTRKQKVHTALSFEKQRKIHELSQQLGKQVELKTNKKGKGKIIIPFSSDEDLNKILERINNNS